MVAVCATSCMRWKRARQGGAPAAQDIEAMVGGDAHEPGVRGGIAAKLALLLYRPHEHIVHGVLRVVIVAQQVLASTEDRTGVPFVEFAYVEFTGHGKGRPGGVCSHRAAERWGPLRRRPRCRGWPRVPCRRGDLDPSRQTSGCRGCRECPGTTGRSRTTCLPHSAPPESYCR